jgi:L-ribulose-5-phosphate 4-epimerase
MGAEHESERGELLAGSLALVEKRLVARTWGNLSLRLDDRSFLVTPSGIPYEDLSPADMVEVDIENLSWSGPLKPSSEKGLHAMVYRMRPALGAIVHTHQSWASAVAATRRGIPALRGIPARAGECGEVPCARYALPTTKALVRSVRAVLERCDAAAMLLANHGALCLGAGLAEAIGRAAELEECARSFALDEFARARGLGAATESELADAFAQARGRARR